jgi:hypothetical protein
MKDNTEQTGNGDIIKTINEIFKEVSDQIMDDAYTRLKYIKKLNPKNQVQEDELIDEVGLED